MDYTDRIRKKIEKELRYYKMQNIRLLQEVEELESIVSHNRERLLRIDGDRARSEKIVNRLRLEGRNNGN